MSKFIAGEKSPSTVPFLTYDDTCEELLFLKGRILTIIDAVVLDEKQNKATKDLIHSEVGTAINNFWRLILHREEKSK